MEIESPDDSGPEPVSTTDEEDELVEEKRYPVKYLENVHKPIIESYDGDFLIHAAKNSTLCVLQSLNATKTIVDGQNKLNQILDIFLSNTILSRIVDHTKDSKIEQLYAFLGTLLKLSISGQSPTCFFDNQQLRSELR